MGREISGNIVGATSGTTSNVIVKSHKSEQYDRSVTYTLRGHIYVRTPFEEFTVTVLPPSANMTLVGPSQVCRGETTEIRFDFIGVDFMLIMRSMGICKPPILSKRNPS